MIDFLFTSEPGRGNALSSALKCFRTDRDLPLQCWEGSWGSLVACGHAYPGFRPVETSRHVCIVLGGPLPRADWSVAAGAQPDDGTEWILDHWMNKGSIRWDEDLVGHFLVACIDKTNGSATVATDINSFIAAYLSGPSDEGHRTAGSHVDALAVAMGDQRHVDPVSAADFLSGSTVTYPYTMYERIRQLPAASEIAWSPRCEPSARTYWFPLEPDTSVNFSRAARLVRNTLQENVKRICHAQDDVGLLLSAGEDSRVIASMVPPDTRVRAVTFSDSFNREVRIAQRVARRMGLDWKFVQRPPTHYLDHAPASVRLAESHRLFLHAHINGLSHELPAGRRILGAQFSDSLFKACWACTRARLGIALRVLPDAVMPRPGYDVEAFGSPLAEDVQDRRRLSYCQMQQFRPKSWAEFVRMLPGQSYPTLSQAASARRLSFSYEPFLDARVVKLAATLPQDWKLNRRLFHRAMKPLLRRTWNIPHGNGTLPYFGLAVNAPLIAAARVKWRVQKLNTRRRRNTPSKNDGAWPLWDELTETSAFEGLWHDSLEAAAGIEALDGLLKTLAGKSETVCGVPRLNGLQVLLWARSLRENET